MRPRWWFGGMLSLCALVVMATIAPLAAQTNAQDGDDGPELARIELVSRRSIRGAVAVPVEVTVTSLGRAIDGELVIEDDDVAVNWEIGVRLAANTEATQTILVPVSPFGGIALDATLVVDGEELAVGELEVRDARDGRTNAVGLVGVDSSEPTIDLSPDVGTAAVYELSNLDVLGGLDSVVVSPAGLRELAEAERRELLNWVSAGHQLLVADDQGSIDEQLPAEWRGSADVLTVGAGFIRYVGSDWEASVPPGPTVASSPQVNQVSGIRHNEIKSDAGFRVPGIGIIASILGVYILLAGPVLFGVLAASGRQRLTWGILPVLAALFTIGVVVTGNILTGGRGNGHATIVEVSPVGAALTDSLLIAESGEQSLRLPDGYSLGASGLGDTGNQTGSPLVIRPSVGGDDLVFEIDEGSGGTAVVRGQSSQFANSFTVGDVRASATEVTGTVTNSTGSTLSNTVVILGNRVAEIGDLATGASESFTIDLTARARQANPEFRVWDININGPFFEGGFGGGDSLDEGPINGSAWTEWRNARNGTSAPTGVVTAVGWTRDVNASLLDGQGRTAFVARSAIESVSGPALPDVVRAAASQAPDPFGLGLEFEFAGQFGDPIPETVQYVRPGGADTSSLALQIENVVTQLEVWVDGDWRSFELPERGRTDLLIPDEAWDGDVLWVRASVSGGFFDPSSTVLEMTVADDGTITAPLLPAGEEFERPGVDFEGGFEEIPIDPNEINEVTLDDEGVFEGDGDIFNSFDQWTIDLRDGDEVTVSMNAFNNGGLDPYLIIRDPDGNQIAENDDFNGLNSRVVFGANGDGVYTIETRPLSGGGQGGTYEVLVQVEFGEPRPSSATTTTTTTAPATVDDEEEGS